MTGFIKICGITDHDAARASADAGADAIGFVFSPSPREIDVSAARAIADGVRSSVKIVAVFRNEEPDHIQRVVVGLEPDLIQADREALSTDHGVTPFPVIREASVVSLPDSMFLYEAESSGVGRGVDLDLARRRAAGRSMVLAGGLTPDNVADVIGRVRPFGVDVSSGVESSPGQKDLDLVEKFVYVARAGLEAVE